jgi:hypothetical protein
MKGVRNMMTSLRGVRPPSPAATTSDRKAPR